MTEAPPSHFYKEQCECIDKLVRARGGIAWWRVGTGKTRIGIEVFESLREVYKWEFPTICVVILKRSAFKDFRDELVKLGTDAVVLEDDLSGLPIATLQNMETKPAFLLLSAGMLTKSIPSLLVDPRVKFGIIDELYMYKNPKSERSKMVQKLSLHKKTVGLSGSVMTAQRVEDVYGQLMAVHKHGYVAPNQTKFKSLFLNMKMAGGEAKRWPMWWPKPGAYKQIMELCKDCVDIYFPSNNARRIHQQVFTVDATPEQEAMFHDLKKWFEYTPKGEKTIELNNSLQVALKVQQISNGWVDDHMVPSNKLSKLRELVLEIIEQGETVVIWCAFRRDVVLLTDFLKEEGIATLQFMSGAEFDHNTWKSGEVKVCVATEAMGVSVNHFAQTPYAIYFSIDYKWFDMQQSQGRTNRYSSLHKDCYYYFIHVEGGLDKSIHQRVFDSRNRELTLIQIGEEVRNWMQKL